MTPQCPKCGSDLAVEVRDGWCCRICHHFWLNAPCKLELQLLANAIQRHTDAARAEAEAREEAATPMTERDHA
jgi:hypothetical protein